MGSKQFVLFPPSHLIPTYADAHRPYLLFSDSALADFSDFSTARPPALSEPERAYDAVVIGLAYDKLSYTNVNTAFRVLTSSASSASSSTNAIPSIPLLATHFARYVRDVNGEQSLGPGPFVAALENAVGGGFKAQVVGANLNGRSLKFACSHLMWTFVGRVRVVYG